MKSIKALITIAIVGLTLMVTANAVMARGWGRQGGGMKYGQSAQGQADRAAKFEEMNQARIQIIMNLTDQSEETITEALKNKPVWAVLEDYGAKFTDFQEQMSVKRVEMIQQAVTDGDITQSQADQMIERMEQGQKGLGRGFGRGPGARGGKSMF